jgi:SAM-dependent methyltransferase
VEDYARKRYRSIDQKLVHLRERSIIKRILGRIPDGEGIILDIPCGYGRFSNLLVRRNSLLINSDYSYQMVHHTQDQTRLIHTSEGIVADAKKTLPIKDDVVRILLSMRFFQHVHDKDERQHILKEFGRVSSGWAILSFYQTSFLHSLQRKLKKKLSGSKRQIRMITRQEFERGLQGTGLKVKKIYPLFKGLHAQHVAFLQSSKLNKKA